jgi:hypothetical protein
MNLKLTFGWLGIVISLFVMIFSFYWDVLTHIDTSQLILGFAVGILGLVCSILLIALSRTESMLNKLSVEQRDFEEHVMAMVEGRK